MKPYNNKFLNKLYFAEFGKNGNGENTNYSEVIKLLKQAKRWKNLKNLQMVCNYLSYFETDEDCDVNSIKGCKEVIQWNIEAFQERL